jgi:hypothetical protein
MLDPISQAAAMDFEERAIKPARELGAYEALWAREGASFKTLADMFRSQRASSTTDAAFYHAICLATVAQAGQSIAERLRWLFCRATRDRSGHIREPIYCAVR